MDVILWRFYHREFHTLECLSPMEESLKLGTVRRPELEDFIVLTFILYFFLKELFEYNSV